ncbi:hypothetical protein D8674_034116 [Pyrus ussuriensis x Pyrus communis]|uniref:Uncharacterized protein n=1 Tax=Pyrus ussuriensis x Pyrus communis TaxID=2448454 RepID=A0A5N5HSU9_9ROSA|nr:hypothetical protein D8674_034116 [Pyrus ussuriensis x Pyrus communis]
MSSSIVISQEALHIINTTNREIFSRLVLVLRRDLAESLMIMALWLFLQEKGYNKFMYKMVRLSNAVLNGLANEAVQCLKCLESTNCPRTISRTAPNCGSLLLTKRLLGKEISLQIISINRYTLISGVKNFVTNVCARIFTDILQRILFPRSYLHFSPEDTFVIPLFPNRLFGSVKIVNPNSSINHGVPTGGIWGWSPFLELSLFMELLGSETCVERVQMANVPPNKQPLYAKLVLSTVVYVDRVLRGTRVSNHIRMKIKCFVYGLSFSDCLCNS